jgi:hypothetical protein
MKRLAYVFSVCLLIAFLAGSCAGSKKCPAYTQVETEQSDNA